MNRICFVALAAGLSACTNAVETPPPQPADVVLAYSAKVPGKWALLVDASKASATLEADTTRCSQIDYPLDLSKFFAETSEATFKTVAEDVRLFDHPLSHAEVTSGGFTGVIAVRVTDFRAGVKTSGLMGGQAAATAEINGTVLVTEGRTHLVDSAQSGKGETEHETGLDCSGIAAAASTASDAAVSEVVRKLAEQFANSRAVRYAVPGLTPQ